MARRGNILDIIGASRGTTRHRLGRRGVILLVVSWSLSDTHACLIHNNLRFWRKLTQKMAQIERTDVCTPVVSGAPPTPRSHLHAAMRLCDSYDS